MDMIGLPTNQIDFLHNSFELFLWAIHIIFDLSLSLSHTHTDTNTHAHTIMACVICCSAMPMHSILFFESKKESASFGLKFFIV